MAFGMRSSGFEKRPSDRMLLLVEDDDDIREALRSLLSIEGYKVGSCCNGLEAIEWLRTSSSKPDLILLDLRMPVMDGWQFRIVQKADSTIAQIPIIALSADSTPQAAAIDAAAYLKKPVDYDTLVATIDRMLVASDHRELQARLAQTDRLTSMGTLAAGVAHEINNPLAYVLLNLGYVSEELTKLLVADVDARVRDIFLALDHARNGAERIRDIVRSLKTFSRSESETSIALDVRHVLDAAVDMVEAEIRHRASLIKEYAVVPTVMANEARLGQVFLNLLLNAVQALPEDRAASNEIRLTVKGELGRVVVEVGDNGMGIPANVQGRIFEPFFSTKPIGVGTGLGLAICHGVVTSLGGTLTFESEVGKGTVFRVEVPSEAAAATAPGAARKGSSRPPRLPTDVPRLQSGRILVVDDEPIVCSSLVRLLSKEGSVTAVTSAVQALSSIHAGERYDLILCDLMLPEMDGQSLYEQLVEIDPSHAERMVFATGGVFTDRARDFLERVPNPRLLKPFDIKALLQLVRERMPSAS
jgi:signal transduction histidine kinase